ncbi:hypothetical protein BC937DRAFT_92804 [Endogone sp. FLAS-F59071]|nr:hypothetical protein BC937DRAFT_92804 [Endogone sp. FLAS-F59071]|eukprot:RUS15168.1 hypothetical protein BC937DRAFT_92804 [Endogone sp. FLAS-F59071]
MPSGKILSASNFAVGSFCLIAVVSYEMCQHRRKHKMAQLRTTIKSANNRKKGTEEHAGVLPGLVEKPEQGGRVPNN